MGCTTSAPAARPSEPEVIAGAGLPAPEPAPVQAAAAHQAEAAETKEGQQSRYPGFDKYPAFLRVAFTFEEKGQIADSQELGLRYARACQELGAELGLEPAILAEAYSNPRSVDAAGAEVVSLEYLPEERWPVTFEFPKQRRKYNLLLGLSGSGKTTMLKTLEKRSGWPLETQIAEPGCDVETLALDDFTYFASWDLSSSSRERARELVEKYGEDIISVCFVVDASDPDRMGDAQQVLEGLLCEASALDGVALLVLANKRDLEGGMPAPEIVQRLQLASLPKRKCFVQSCCAVTGDGIYQGIAWLSQAIGVSRTGAQETTELTTAV